MTKGNFKSPEKKDHEPIVPARLRRKKKPLPGRRISIETYNKMLAAYLEKQSASHVAKTVGVAEKTAMRYIELGDKERNLLPLAQRLRTINDLARQQQDYDLARARSDFQKAARATFLKTAQRIQEMDPMEMSADKLPEHLNKLLTVIERTFGEAEHKHEVRGKFTQWTLAELKNYLEGGVVPASRD